MKVCKNAPPMRITVNGDPISEVSSLKYLGARFSDEALCDEEISRLALARERMRKLDPLWRSRATSLPLKARLTQTLAWPRKLLGMVKTRKLKYFGHISRHTLLEKDIMSERCQASEGKAGSISIISGRRPHRMVKQINTGPSPDGTRQVDISKVPL